MTHALELPWYHARFLSYDSRLAREFGPPPKAYLRDLGRTIDRRIGVFWTGEKVISEGYPAMHLAEVAADIGRKPFIWDNRISNDSKTRTNHLFLDPAAAAWELDAGSVAGFSINPMNQPHLSRIALCRYLGLLYGTAERAHSPSADPRDRILDRQRLPAACRNLLSPPFAEQLDADAGLLQAAGLDRIDPETRRTLLDRYGSDASNPYACEIAAWLRGKYAFDPQCLTN